MSTELLSLELEHDLELEEKMMTSNEKYGTGNRVSTLP
jgi:hypothetical protein